MKGKDNLHHMHIELAREQYATLCANAKKSGLTKRAFIVQLLEGAEIDSHKIPPRTPGTLGRTLLWVSTKALPLFRKPLSPN